MAVSSHSSCTQSCEGQSRLFSQSLTKLGLSHIWTLFSPCSAYHVTAPLLCKCPSLFPYEPQINHRQTPVPISQTQTIPRLLLHILSTSLVPCSASQQSPLPLFSKKPSWAFTLQTSRSLNAATSRFHKPQQHTYVSHV